jgi:hypothetical protein
MSTRETPARPTANRKSRREPSVPNDAPKPDATTKIAPVGTRVREGADNLRNREDAFKRRRGGKP